MKKRLRKKEIAELRSDMAKILELLSKLEDEEKVMNQYLLQILNPLKRRKIISIHTL